MPMEDSLLDLIRDLREAVAVRERSPNADEEALQEAGRVISAANKDVLKKMHGLATGMMHGFPGAGKIAEMCQGLLDSDTLDLNQMQEAAGILDFEQHMQEAEREFSTDIRKEYADKGVALPDGSYPIPDKGALRRAIMSIGRASDQAAAKRHIIKRAKALDATDMLPDDWNIKEAQPFQLWEDHRFVEAVQGTDGREWDVILIESGTSGNGYHYDGKVLKEAAPLFSGVSAFA